MALKTDTFRGPSFLASALINGDYSGLSEDDTAACEWLLKWVRYFYGRNASICDCVDAGFARDMSPLIPASIGEQEAPDNAAGLWLGGDTQEYTVLYGEATNVDKIMVEIARHDERWATVPVDAYRAFCVV